MIHLETHYLRMHRNRSLAYIPHRPRYTTHMGGHENPTFLFCDRLRDVVIVTEFWRESAKIGIPHLSLCVGIPQWIGGSRFHTGNVPSTSDLVDFVQVAAEFCRRVAPGGLTLGFATPLVKQVRQWRPPMPITRHTSTRRAIFHERRISSVTFTSVHLHSNVYMRMGVARAMDELASAGASVPAPRAGRFVRFWASGGAKFPK